MIDKWTKGELNELLFMKSKEQTDKRIIATCTFSKK